MATPDEDVEYAFHFTLVFLCGCVMELDIMAPSFPEAAYRMQIAALDSQLEAAAKMEDPAGHFVDGDGRPHPPLKIMVDLPQPGLERAAAERARWN